MLNTGLVLPSSGAGVPGASVDWVTPGNVTADDGATASVTLTALGASDFLAATAFGFLFDPGATIEGVVVEAEITAVTVVTDPALEIFLTKDGTNVVGNVKTMALAIGTFSVGGVGDLWGATLSDTEAEASTFGALFRLSGTNTEHIALDKVRLLVYYSDPAVVNEPSVLRVSGSNARW